MTKTYSTQDGRHYTARNVTHLAAQLWAESKTGNTTKGAWRIDAAYRAGEATGRTIRGDSDAHFVQDLIDAGLIKETEE